MIALHEEYKENDHQHDQPKNTGNASNTNNVGLVPRKSAATSKRYALAAFASAQSSRLLSVSKFYQEVLQKFLQTRANHQERKEEKLALNRLLQLDDALLRDMGIKRHDLEAVKSGNLTLDALNKHGIVASRDNSSNTNINWKQR